MLSVCAGAPGNESESECHFPLGIALVCHVRGDVQRKDARRDSVREGLHPEIGNPVPGSRNPDY